MTGTELRSGRVHFDATGGRPLSSRLLKITMFFNYLFDVVNEKKTTRTRPVREPAFKNCAKNRRDGSFRRIPLMTPLLPSVIRIEWTA